LRARESRRVLDRLGEYLEGPLAKSLLPASKLGGAFNTIRNHWEAFNVFVLDVACCQRAEDGTRCRDVFRERHNAHAPRDGQDPGVVSRSLDRSASERWCKRTASKSGAIRPIRPSCKLHGVGYVQSFAKANSTSEDPCLQSHTHGYGSANRTLYKRRRASVGHRLPPQCWLRRATNRSIHLEPLTGHGHISKPEHQ